MPAPVPDPALAGLQIGKYRLISLLAKGGMGELYRARASGPGDFERDVALKVVRADLAQRTMFKAMFLEEGKIAALLQHANVVHVNDFGEDQGRLYLCMELVDGRNAAALIEQCREGRELLAPAYATYIAEQIAHALDHAHNLEVDGQPLNLVHRDVSPGNILLSYQGAVKLTDFGVARIRREKSLTVAGMRKGTPAYMAPEQLQNLTDPRSDIFSLAAVLWELLVGHPLFEGKTDEQLAEAVRNRPIPPPSTYAPDVPPALDAVALKALQRDPRARHQTAREFAVALADLALTPRVDAFELGRELRRRFPTPPNEPAPGPLYEATDPHIPLLVAERAAAYEAEPATEPGLPPPAALPSERASEARTPPKRAPLLPPRERSALAPAGAEGRGEGASRPRRSSSLWRALVLILPIAAATTAVLLKRSLPVAPHPVPPSPSAPTLAPPSPTLAPIASAEPPPPKPIPMSPAPKPHKPVPLKKRGSLYVIDCLPWAEVVIDHQHHNLYSPLPAHPIPAGKHDIELVNPEQGIDRHLTIKVPEGGAIYLMGDPRTLQSSSEAPPDRARSP